VNGEIRSGEEKEKAARVVRVDRKQVVMRVVDIEGLIEEGHPARGIWEMLGRVDLGRYYDDIESVEGEAGRAAYDPRMMATLWMYGYSEGVGEARELGRRCGYHPAYQWITGLQEISYHTLSDFRVKHKEALDELFMEILGILSAEGLITLERVTHDGTKIKAQCSAGTFRREGTLREHMEMAKRHVEKIAAGGDEEGNAAGVKEAAARRRGARDRAKRIESALRELEKVRETKRGTKAKENVRISRTEPEARVMKHGDGGYAPSYNAQVTTDTTAGMIVGVGLTDEASDYGQLVPSIERVEAQAGKRPGQVVTDGGFTSRGNVIEAEMKGVDLLGSWGEKNEISAGQMRRRGVAQDFMPDKFRYDESWDAYTCPAGKILVLEGKERKIGRTNYRYRAKVTECGACPCKGQCCPQNTAKGRSISRGVDDPAVEAFRKKMETPEAKEIYRLRGRWSEFVNAWIKEKMGLRKFHLLGKGKALMELLWICATYNVKQWIRLSWRRSLAEASIA
jgi:transposase